MKTPALACIGIIVAFVAVAQRAAPPAAVPEADVQRVEELLAEKAFETAIEVSRDILDGNPEAAGTATPLLVRAYEGAGRPDEAASALRKLAAHTGTTQQIIEDLKRLAAACADAGKLDAAKETYDFILEQFPAAMDRYLGGGPAGYGANRKVLDQGAEYARLVRAMSLVPPSEAPSENVASTEFLRIFNAYPEAPGTRATCLEIARQFHNAGNYRGALVFCMRVVNYSGDRTRPTTTKLPDNQAYLDTISSPNTEGTLREVLGIINDACSELGTAERLNARELPVLAERWADAENAAYSVLWNDEWTADSVFKSTELADAHYPATGDDWHVNERPLLPRWEALIEDCRGTVFEPLAEFSLGQWLHYRGTFSQAHERYQRAAKLQERLPGLNAWLSFEGGELAVQTGRPADARPSFLQCRSELDTPLEAEAQLRGAECLECQGLVAEALAENEAIAASDGYPVFVRRRARYALRRLSEAREGLSHVRASGDDRQASYLGQDRLAQGDWRLRGRDLFVLCACHGWSDVSGGALAPVQYRVSTADPNRKAYWWHGGDAPDPSMIYDPADNPRGPRNWDDGGEKYTPATGPDLVTEFPVPPGTFRMGLYFVNDRNYYEPNRQYTVYLTDAESGAVLAVAPMRDFVSGVYAEFSVAGPRTLRVRVWRNLSLNTLLTGLFLDGVSSVPDWPALRAAALTGGVPAAPADVDWSASEAAWEAYRAAWVEWRGPLEERRGLVAFADTFPPALGWYLAGKMTEAIARHLLELGFVGQSCVLEDRALRIMARQSPRRYADALSRAVGAYGRRTPFYAYAPTLDDSHAKRMSTGMAAVWQEYALAKLDQYAGLVATPRSLVAPQDLIALGHRYWGEDQHVLARRCFELAAPDGDVQKLTPVDTYQYAKSLHDKPLRTLRLEALLGLLAREEPLPVPRSYVHSDLVFLCIQLGRLDEAGAQMTQLAELDAPADVKYAAAAQLAVALSRGKEVEGARRWAEYVLEEFPGSSVVPMVQDVLRKTAGANAQEP